jgi:hypothetical protein
MVSEEVVTESIRTCKWWRMIDFSLFFPPQKKTPLKTLLFVLPYHTLPKEILYGTILSKGLRHFTIACENEKKCDIPRIFTLSFFYVASVLLHHK